MFENLTTQQISWIDRSIPFMPVSGHFLISNIGEHAQITDPAYQQFMSDFLINNLLAIPHILDIGYRAGNLILTPIGRDLKRLGSSFAYSENLKLIEKKQRREIVKQNVNLFVSIIAGVSSVIALALQIGSYKTAEAPPGANKGVDTIKLPDTLVKSSVVDYKKSHDSLKLLRKDSIAALKKAK